MNICKCGKSFKNAGAHAIHRNSCLYVKHPKECELIRSDYKNKLLISDIKKKYCFTRNEIHAVVKDILRSDSETNKIAHTNPNRKKYHNINSNFAKKVMCEKCKRTISVVNLYKHTCVSEEVRESIIKLYNLGLSPRDIRAKGYDKRVISFSLSHKRRSLSDSIKARYKNHPETFKLSKATKDKIRQSILKARQNGIAYSWTRKKPSYAESKFHEFLVKLGLKENVDFFTEFPFSIYRADFYFPKHKLVIEIDGEQHVKYDVIRERDKRKDEYLKNHDIKVLRIRWKDVHHNHEVIYDEIKDILNNSQNFELRLDTFTKAQARRLQLLTEFEINRDQLKIEKQQIKKLEQQARTAQQTKDILQSDFTKRGTVENLSNKWNVSHTQVRRLVNRYMTCCAGNRLGVRVPSRQPLVA